ncbi:hypothetical protein O9992_30380 [Vibrio lentus]|nr:hypothetical protein [Vibrio lentus]
MSAQDIGTVLSRLSSEGFVNYFSMDQRSYQVITQVPNENRNSWMTKDYLPANRIPVRWYRWLMSNSSDPVGHQSGSNSSTAKRCSD